MSENTGIVLIFLLVIVCVMLTRGDPDVLDGLIKWANAVPCEVE